ncbi:hypothetical protein C6A85_13435, partial [Mycobacterium sp. ITM-2017-0098]
TLCIPEKNPNCLNVAARPRLAYYEYYESKVWLVDGRYTFTVDQPHLALVVLVVRQPGPCGDVQTVRILLRDAQCHVPEPRG